MAVSPIRGAGRQRSHSVQQRDSSPRRQKSPRKMTVIESPPTLFVRALYDYNADDHTSLSFRQGDVIQVLNQLETGWWDGVMGNVRGWFPSNYCAIITDPNEIEEHLARRRYMTETGDTDADSGGDDDYYDDDRDDQDYTPSNNPRDSQPILPIEGTGPAEHEEAAYWIPQATPDGRLYYFNTLTGTSTMELPLENPNTVSESGPRDRTNVNVPDQTRPPPEMMARGVERDENDYDGSGSEGEGEALMLASRDSNRRRPMNGAPSTASADSGSSKSLPQHRKLSTSTGAHSSGSGRPSTSTSIPRHFVDDGLTPPVTWSSLVDNMRQAVTAYRHTLLQGDRSEYVRRAEDISDHLRMLLAAGSDTTDDHSGNPSIISNNRPLYNHFREMMSKFSKLVLSSHIAAADWSGPESVAKCLQEADGVLQAVYGYVEVARQQRGDNINRIVPGFVLNGTTGGNWKNNGLRPTETQLTSFLDPDGQDSNEPSILLDSTVVDQIDSMRKMLVHSVRRLEERLTLNQKLITKAEHYKLGEAISAAALDVLDHYRPWIAKIESINLAPLGSTFQNPQLADFGMQKQKVYDTVADLVLHCQAVAAPLGDEWAQLRGDSLEDRLNAVRTTARQLENQVSQIGFSLVLLQEQFPSERSQNYRNESRFVDDDDDPIEDFHDVLPSRPAIRRRATDTSGNSGSTGGVDDPLRRNMQKAERFFGQAPPPTITREPAPAPPQEETPWFLAFDHENEVFFDTKSETPTLKCGTLAGLVEQLTRHDKLDASFNNTFLLTYRSFTTAQELFEMLVDRFMIQPPPGLTPDEFQLWTDRKQKPIRFRVVNILKSWFENYWMEPNNEANMELLRRVYAFTKESIAASKTPGTQQLLTIIEQRLRGQDTTVKRLVPTNNAPMPQPILPKNMKKLKFLDIDPTEFARQLTIIESRLYAKIRPIECLNKTWQKKVAPGEEEPAANVKALILHSNQLTNWVAEMILMQSDVRKRVVVIKHFVNVAEVSNLFCFISLQTCLMLMHTQKCRALNNYSTLTAIISALGTAPISRLSRTWAQVSGRTSQTLEQLRRLMASTKNFGEYRETLHAANPPCIPFFGNSPLPLTVLVVGLTALQASILRI